MDTITQDAVELAQTTAKELESLPNINFSLGIERVKAGSISNKKLTPLIENQGVYQLTSKGLNIDLLEPWYLSSVRVHSTKGKLRLFVKQLAGGVEKKINISNKGDTFCEFTPKVLASTIRVDLEDTLWKFSDTITSIEIYGYREIDLPKIYSEIGKAEDIEGKIKALYQETKDAIKKAMDGLEKKKNELKEYEDSVSQSVVTKNNEIIELESTKDSLETDIIDLKSQVEALTSRTEILKTSIASSTAKETSIASSIEVKESKQRLLTNSIAEAEMTLADLKEKVNIFPDNLEGFAERATKAKITYYCLAVIPLAILATFAVRIVISSEALLGQENLMLQQVEAFLLQRIPYVLVVSTVVGGAFAFLMHVLKRVEEVHQQEMNISKISLVARDISIGEYGEDDSDESKQRRLDLKIRMIQEYLYAEIKRSEVELNKDSVRYQLFGLDVDKLLNKFGIGEGINKKDNPKN